MQEKFLRPITGELAATLTAKKLSLFPNRHTTRTLLEEWGILPHIAALFPIQSRITCAQVLELCAPALHCISPTPPEEGWLKFSFQYTRHLMFPHLNQLEQTQPLCSGAQFYLSVLQYLFRREREALPFDWRIDFRLLSEEELTLCDDQQEYRAFLSALHRDYVYEMLRLSDECNPYRTLSHVTGVHYVAMTAARGLKDAGVEVDLALISAAAYSHDLGKFGCRPGERVPYLHYYYTEQWLLRHQMERTARIAANHSTWDLELDSLSVEALCLIYADFRSKQTKDDQGREVPVLYHLKDSYHVILSKLDQVDSQKLRRYELVYGKLHDFEDFMRKCGVDVDLTGSPQTPQPDTDPALTDPMESIQALILLSVEHNLQMMHRLSNERKFGNIIEAARSAKDWKQLRAYLDVFGEYFSYLSETQKRQALAFLYELLVHREGDIRRQAAALIGQIIARFHMGYRKEIPADAANPGKEIAFTLWEQFLSQIIYPDHRTTAQQRSHIGYTLKLVMDAMLQNSRKEDIYRFVSIFLSFFHLEKEMSADTAFTLLDAIRYLPPQYYNLETRGALIEFAAFYAQSPELRLRTAALLFLREAARILSPTHPQMRRIVQAALDTPGEELTLIFLRYQLLLQAGENVAAYQRALYEEDVTGEVFLENLKIATPWITKVVGVELLCDQVEHGLHHHILHISTHFSNLVKVSERVVVRHNAGEALIRTLPGLSREQRNEVVVELGKGLEMGQYELSKYIPQYLGEAAIYLHPSELDEQILWLKTLLGSPNDSAVTGALNTIGVLLQYYPSYQTRFSESGEQYEGRRELLLGMLLQGLAHHRVSVQQETLLVIGKILFESKTLDMQEKGRLFSLSYRKLLFLIREGHQPDELSFYFRASALSHLYHFISLQRLDHGSFSFRKPDKIAFFPGTFDPFTLSHQGIVHAIRDLGFEVYLAVDEFSWSKKSQPHLIRRQIVNMSVAGDFQVHLFPNDIPVNIANPRDLARLKALFPKQEVYLVMGSDVVRYASAYTVPPVEHSIHSMNHIIFRRASETPLKKKKRLPITGKIIELHLPPHLEDISSTRIRENVDSNRDISNFIDPVIQDFIYQNGLYLRDSQDKPMVHAGLIQFEWIDRPEPEFLQLLAETVPNAAPFCQHILHHGDHMLLLRHSGKKRPLCFATYRSITTADLFSALQNVDLADRIRLRAAGKTLLITSILSFSSKTQEDVTQLLLSEVLAAALKDACVYCLYLSPTPVPSPTLIDLLERQGFRHLEKGLPLYEADMRTPTVLIQNLETTIQEPLCHNRRVLTAINRGHQRLQTALTALYPGSLVLTLSTDTIHQRLLEMITTYNGVPITPSDPRQLGECMCVPFGKLLRGKIVPNTVSKTIHTDKVYTPDLTGHTIEAFPYYSPIPSQIRTIKSFQRPVILVDDLMHPGNRFKVLDPLLHQEEVDLRMVLVGVLSGHGRDIMDDCNRPVDSAYFLPSLRQWFLESTLYPFIGGNTVRRPVSPAPGLLPGINHILPYAKPGFAEECSPEAVYELSRCCLESARDVIITLEQEYRALYARNLTLSRLSEAVILPLCPDKGTCLKYDPNLSASVYLENDLEDLLRTALSI